MNRSNGWPTLHPRRPPRPVLPRVPPGAAGAGCADRYRYGGISGQVAAASWYWPPEASPAPTTSPAWRPARYLMIGSAFAPPVN